MTTRVWSQQQLAVFEAVKEALYSILLVAVAGSGKTTTVTEAVRYMTGTVALLAFNKKIAMVLESVIATIPTLARVKAGTFHSFGNGAVRRAFPNAAMKENKVIELMARRDVPEELRPFVRQIVSLAKQRAFGFLTPVEDDRAWFDMVSHYELDSMLSKKNGYGDAQVTDLVEQGIIWGREILCDSIATNRQMIDFDDMIYVPLIADLKMWQNDWVIVDEVQDTNPARRALAKKILRPGGKFIGVGDPHQAIYGFTGADNDAMDIIEREFGARRMPLTVTYRCPKSHVTLARTFVSHITAADTAPDGQLLRMEKAEFDKHTTFSKDDAILCRFTKPIVEAAYSLIRRGIGCHVEGKEIGRGLLKLAMRWSRVEDLDQLRDRLTAHLEKETAKLLAKGQERQAEALADRVETLHVIMQKLPADAGLADLQREIETLFGDTPEGEAPRSLTLSTIHKAKGREWDVVYLLGREQLMPSKFARQQWQLDQETNLMYVAVTRAKQTLIEVAL